MYKNTPSPAGLLMKPIDSRSNNPLPSRYVLINHPSHYQTCITLISSQPLLIPQSQVYRNKCFFVLQVTQYPKLVVRGGTQLQSTFALNFRHKYYLFDSTPTRASNTLHFKWWHASEICKELIFFLTWNRHSYVTNTVNYLGSTVQESHE